MATINFTNYADYVDAYNYGGENTYHMLQGNDTFYGDNGRSTVWGDYGDDTIYGGYGLYLEAPRPLYGAYSGVSVPRLRSKALALARKPTALGRSP